MRRSLHSRNSAFTLIELLIVVAIIAILTAIAVPNFLHAQVRAKVAKAQADFRNVAVAMEAYQTDHHDYPPAQGGAFFRELAPLTTPVPYMAQIPLDPLRPWDVCPQDTDHDADTNTYEACKPPGDSRLRDGGGYNMIRFNQSSQARDKFFWGMQGLGPDHDEEGNYLYPIWSESYRRLLMQRLCDPSNGLQSSGDMFRFGPSDPLTYK